jgi:hypothetical protein
MESRLVRWVVLNDQSFLVVESPSFRALVDYLRPGVGLIKADGLKNLIISSFASEMTRVKQKLAALNSRVSFTTDIWTAPNGILFN